MSEEGNTLNLQIARDEAKTERRQLTEVMLDPSASNAGTCMMFMQANFGGGQIAYKDANDAMAERMANALLDPRVTAELMRKGVTNPTVAQIQSAIKKVGVIAGSGSAVLLAADPE